MANPRSRVGARPSIRHRGLATTAYSDRLGKFVLSRENSSPGIGIERRYQRTACIHRTVRKTEGKTRGAGSAFDGIPRLSRHRPPALHDVLPRGKAKTAHRPGPHGRTRFAHFRRTVHRPGLRLPGITVTHDRRV